VSIGNETITCHDDGGDPDVTADDGIYTGRLIVPSSLIVVNETASGVFTDPAGNQAQRSSEQSLIIN
jgi:hypothetical protein